MFGVSVPLPFRLGVVQMIEIVYVIVLVLVFVLVVVVGFEGVVASAFEMPLVNPQRQNQQNPVVVVPVETVF